MVGSITPVGGKGQAREVSSEAPHGAAGDVHTLELAPSVAITGVALWHAAGSTGPVGSLSVRPEMR